MSNSLDPQKEPRPRVGMCRNCKTLKPLKGGTLIISYAATKARWYCAVCAAKLLDRQGRLFE